MTRAHGQLRSRDKDIKGDCVLRWEGKAVLCFCLIKKDKWASLLSV